MTAPSRITLDALDNLDRFTSQIQAVVNGLLANDHFKDLSPKVVADSLWLVSDRLMDIADQLDTLSVAQEPMAQPVSEHHLSVMPFMIRRVATNTPAWWDGFTPAEFEYKAARWTAGGKLDSASFKTAQEAEAWVKEVSQ